MIERMLDPTSDRARRPNSGKTKGTPGRGPLRLVSRPLGPIRARHFAHAPTHGCYPETVVHDTAKQLIAQVVTDWVGGRGPRPVVEKACQLCRRAYLGPLGDQIETATFEHRLPTGLVADAALLRHGEPIGVVEIRVSHAVDRAKASRLTLPWVELRGDDVVKEPRGRGHRSPGEGPPAPRPGPQPTTGSGSSGSAQTRGGPECRRG